MKKGRESGPSFLPKFFALKLPPETLVVGQWVQRFGMLDQLGRAVPLKTLGIQLPFHREMPDRVSGCVGGIGIDVIQRHLATDKPSKFCRVALLANLTDEQLRGQDPGRFDFDKGIFVQVSVNEAFYGTIELLSYPRLQLVIDAAHLDATRTHASGAGCSSGTSGSDLSKLNPDDCKFLQSPLKATSSTAAAIMEDIRSA